MGLKTMVLTNYSLFLILFIKVFRFNFYLRKMIFINLSIKKIQFNFIYNQIGFYYFYRRQLLPFYLQKH